MEVLASVKLLKVSISTWEPKCDQKASGFAKLSELTIVRCNTLTRLTRCGKCKERSGFFSCAPGSHASQRHS